MGRVGCMCFGWIECIGLKVRSGFESGMPIIGSGTHKDDQLKEGQSALGMVTRFQTELSFE